MNLLDSSNNHVEAKALNCICSESKNMIVRLFSRAGRLKMFTARLLRVFLATIQYPLFLITSLTTATILHQISLSRNFLPISPFISTQEDSKRKKPSVVKETLSRKELCSIVFIVPNELNQLKVAHDLG